MSDMQYYLVPGRLTDKQRRVIRMALSSSMNSEPAFIRMVQEVGTPIKPCADVETVGYLKGTEPPGSYRNEVPVTYLQSIPRDIPLVRRTDMEVQVAKVDAERIKWQTRYERVRWRFLQDAKDEKRDLTAERFDALVDNDNEAHASLIEGSGA